MGKDEREALRQAADAASALLPKKHQERARVDAEIASLKAVVDAWEMLSGRRAKKLDTVILTGPDQDHAKIGRAPRGQVVKHVDEVMAPGNDLTEPEIRKTIQARFGVAYRRSAVYTVLRRGRKRGRYEQIGEKWRKKVA